MGDRNNNSVVAAETARSDRHEIEHENEDKEEGEGKKGQEGQDVPEETGPGRFGPRSGRGVSGRWYPRWRCPRRPGQ